jgi:hypothetical protein
MWYVVVPYILPSGHVYDIMASFLGYPNLPRSRLHLNEDLYP